MIDDKEELIYDKEELMDDEEVLMDDEELMDEEELMDDEDRRLIDNAILQQATGNVTPKPTICTNPRCDWTGILENLDPDFCESVLPL